MRSSLLAAVVVALASVVSAAPALAGRPLRLEGAGDLAPTAEGSPADGAFRLVSTVRRDGSESARIEGTVSDLDATRDATGALPVYRVVLASGDGAGTNVASFRVDRRGRGRFRVSRAALPGPEPTLRAFEGGTISVLRDDATVLSGAVPRLAFPGAGASTSRSRVFGRMEGVDQPRRSPGTYEIASSLDEAGRLRNTVLVVSPRLPTDPNAAGVRPDYRVVLLAPNGGQQVDLGTMQLEVRLGAALSLDSSKAPLPGSIADLREFGGGKIEIRRGGTVLCRGFVVPFPAADDRPIAQRDVRSTGAEELSSPGSARARISARLDLYPASRRQRLSVEPVGLAPGTYSVVAVHSSGTRTPLGSFTAPRALRVAAARAAALPGGSLTWLSGQDVEVRDAGGTVVLSGRFPTIR